MKWLPIAILFSGMYYIFFFPEQSGPLDWLLKILPMLLIYVYAHWNYLNNRQPIQRFILFGLLFGGLGDILIEFHFLAGLFAFLIGHLFYSHAFRKQWTFSPIRIFVLVPILYLAYKIGLEILLAAYERNLPQLYFPVILYVLTIAFMCWFAVMTGNLWAIFGSCLFLLSDTLLAWHYFIESIGAFHFLILMTYYSGQFLIAKSIPVRKREMLFQPLLP